ncbi:mitochondrial E3 ubiquitin protein ligase 1 [Hyalella azteca]|uniref:RING-type E3 ubiquitin transferase n=1 Tax=Hyalella azteca TaxID=294128 RepID=A0A8B7NAM6_HYAAZ|nr:mitochondrial E3 ubiquitin protein ligase 1 [Hyalella azteca]
MWPESLTAEILGACICGGCSYLLFRSYHSQVSLTERLKAAPDFRSSNIVNQTGQVMMAGTTGFLYGTVKPASGLTIRADSSSKSQQKVTGVFSRRTVSEMMMTQIFGLWSTNERIVNVEHEAVPFLIVDGNLQVQISEPLRLESVPLQVVAESYEPSNASFFSSLISVIQGYHLTGVKHTQEMLVSDTEVVGLGRLVLKSSGFHLEPDSSLPFLVSAHGRESIIQSYEMWIPYLKIGSWIFGLASAAFVGRLVYRRVRRWVEDWRKRDEERAYNVALRAAEGAAAEDLPAKLSCITCFGLRNAVLVPCSHVLVCLNCVKQLKGQCPTCRADIRSVQPLIFS